MLLALTLTLTLELTLAASEVRLPAGVSPAATM